MLSLLALRNMTAKRNTMNRMTRIRPTTATRSVDMLAFTVSEITKIIRVIHNFKILQT